jgi:signal transduction histidine kinase/ligand-binding sensor domain-containing protein/CheY-like chemotaxis protein
LKKRLNSGKIVTVNSGNKTKKYPTGGPGCRAEISGLLLMLLFLLLPPGLPGVEKSIRFHHLSIEDRLSQSTINTILQDKRGFMWFGTEEGLNRYDGHGFVHLKFSLDNPNSLGGDFIYTHYEDRQGVLWVGTGSGGLTRFDPLTEQFTRYRHDPGDAGTLSNNVVRAVYEDRRGVLWVGTVDGLNRFDARTKTFIHYKNIPGDPTSLSHKEVRCIVGDLQGNPWIGTWGGGLNRLNRGPDGTYTFTRFLESPHNPNSLTDDRVSSIQVDPAGWFYIGTAGGFTHFDPVTGTAVRYQKPPGTPNSLADNRINALYLDMEPSGTSFLWICTDKGLHRFNCRTKKISGYRDVPNAPKSLSNKLILSFYKDRAGNYWIGTNADGIYRFNPASSQFGSYLKNTDNPDSLVDSSVNCIYRDRKGMTWIGTAGGLKKSDRDTNQITHYVHKPGNPNSLGSNDVRCILEDHTGTLWIGTRGGGLNRLDRDKNRFNRYLCEPDNPDSLGYNDVRCLHEDHTGTLWIGTNGGGLNRLDPARKHFTHYKNNPDDPYSLSDNNIRAIYEDRSHVLWIGTRHGGINRFNRAGEQFTRFTHNPRDADSINGNFVLCIMEDKHDFLWIGTAGFGLDQLDPSRKHFSHFTDADGLPNNKVYGILEDEQGSLWLSTNYGLSRFNPEDKIKPFTNYYWSDGLQSNEFNYGSYFKSKSGEMFFGGINGFNAFYPGNIKPNNYKPPVYITGFQLFNKAVSVGEGPDGRTLLTASITDTKTIELTHEDYIFSFQFAALNYISPEKNQYKYIMDGFEKEWNYVKNRNFASYVNLSHGEYTFRVKGSNNHGMWNEQGASLKLVIKPPFWETWWFKVIVVVFIIGSIYVIYRMRMDFLENKRKELERMVSQRTEELQKQREAAQTANEAKSQFLARMSHEIRTPLNAVIGFTEILLDTRLGEEQLDYAKSIQESGDLLLLLINDILDFSKIEAGQLSLDTIDFDPEITIYNICELISPRKGTKPIEMLCRIDDSVPAFVKGDPTRFRQVVLNMVGNAVKFTDAGEIEMSLDVDEIKGNRIKLHTIVRDTGIGIPEDKIASIFEVFQQVDGTITRKFGGTGLGLAICKQIAKLMKGDVWAESQPGKGSVFHFTAWVEGSGKTVSPRTVPRHLPGKKALIVDDNSNNLDVLSHQLQKVGMRIVGLSDGREVVTELQKHLRSGDPFDLCILDIRLSGKSGLDILQDIRRLDDSLSKLPVLAFSSSSHGRIKRYQDAGFDGYLPKPVSRQKLIQMMSRLLEGEIVGPDEKEVQPLVTRHTLAEEAKQSVRILLAEDNPINQKLARYVLTKAGYHLQIVNNGKEAVEAYTSAPENFDLILMDVQMPVMDGKEATKIIREKQKGSKKIPIIAVTAASMKGDREKLLAVGMDDYISKPIKRVDIYEMVKKWALSR